MLLFLKQIRDPWKLIAKIIWLQDLSLLLTGTVAAAEKLDMLMEDKQIVARS